MMQEIKVTQKNRVVQKTDLKEILATLNMQCVVR
jgi:hypothetical protein